MEICGQFLFRQLSSIRPKAICALGSTAAKAVLGTKDGVTKLRGKWHKWRDIPGDGDLPPVLSAAAYNQDAKKEAWEDLKAVLHYVYDCQGQPLLFQTASLLSEKRNGCPPSELNIGGSSREPGALHQL